LDKEMYGSQGPQTLQARDGEDARRSTGKRVH
jgi:hypothetical protein